MKVFFDCEFTGLHQATSLVSIGLVAENGREFYAELTDYAQNQVDAWIEQNVIRQLSLKVDGPQGDARIDNLFLVKGDREVVKHWLEVWFSTFDQVEMWADVLAYDWVIFCQIFGGALHIPKNIYYIPFDLATLFKFNGINPDIERNWFAGQVVNTKHNSLWDARITKSCYEKLMGVS